MTDIKKYERQCPNWVESFKAWTMPRSEASETFILWTAVWVLAAALRRRVYIPKKFLGSWTCYPYLYVMFVAPAGMRKTTTIGYAIELLQDIPDLPAPPTFVTGAALVDSILNAPDHAVYLTVEEFGDIILKGGDEMFEFLTSMFDGKKELRQKTMLRGVEQADKPTINMIAGTTPRWIAEKMPQFAAEGGFASRVVWVYEDKVRQRRMFYRNVDHKSINKIQDALEADLKHISQLTGEFDIEEEAINWLEHWYQNHENDPRSARLKRYPGYLNRKPVMILKVAMLLHLAYSDELVLRLDDFKQALKLVEATEPNFPKVFVGVGKNEYALEMKDIVALVNELGEVPEKDLLKWFEYAAAPAKLNELIAGVLQTGDIISEQTDDGTRVFKPGD